MFEVEIKAYLDDITSVETRLQQLDAIFQKSIHQSDTYFQHPIRNFAQTDEALRIRISNNQSYLTYKGPKLDSSSKTREELELKIQKPDKTSEILKKLGFSPVLIVTKTRKIYSMDDIIISIDDVDDLGYFIEFELEVTDKEIIPSARDRLISLLNKLGIPKDKLERRSYLELRLLKMLGKL
ncbi:MAG: class IV adenylate cyclase [Candidatus Helarchaeota archaeon]|nr:class IV adenylate cyclase [Candidatus Helarchaeota archaeon]